MGVVVRAAAAASILLRGSTRIFQKTPCTDDIEMRVCRDEDSSNEDTAIEMVEIYVQ